MAKAEICGDGRWISRAIMILKANAERPGAISQRRRTHYGIAALTDRSLRLVDSIDVDCDPVFGGFE